MDFIKFLSFLIVLPVLYASKIRYDGYQLVQLRPTTIEQINILKEWKNDPEFDMWNEVKGTNTTAEVMLSKSVLNKYKQLFLQNGLTYEILEYNIQKKIDEEYISMATTRMKYKIEDQVVGKYARHHQVNKYLDKIARQNPSFVSVYLAGKTYEKRELKVVKFKTATTKRSVWLNCGIHARERITVSTCTYMIDKLLRKYLANDPLIVDLLSYYEIHILPIANPDGYEYTFTTERLWRKNRVPNANSKCIGTDLNRNFPFKWMENNGASSNPCSDAYAGSKPISELETQAIVNIIESKLGDWDSYLDIHSYGQWYLVPYGYTDELPPYYDEMMRLAKVSANAIKSYQNTEFTVGNSYELLYVSSGTTDDYAYSKGIKFSYTVELQPSSKDSSIGFLLPEDKADGVGEEIYRGVVALYAEIKRSNTL